MPEHRFEPLTAEVMVPAQDDVVLVCGTKPLEVLRQASLAPKNRGLAGLRETPPKRKAEGGSYLVTYDPAIIRSEPTRSR